MIVAQISDLHLGYDLADADELNTRRCQAVIAHVASLQPAPDLVVVSGDLTEHGDAASYRRLRDMLAPLTMPVHLGLGNHDRRAAFREVFAEVPAPDGFVQYAIDAGEWRVVMLDTLDEGRAGGAFCEHRAAWLEAALAAAPDRPTLVMLHHPPFAIGIDWMDPPQDAAWIERLRGVVRRYRCVRALAAGHVHRTVTTLWADRVAAVVSSVAPQLALDLAPTDPAAPDGRPLIVAEAPGFALHRIVGDTLVTHFARVDNAHVLARLDVRTAPAIAAIMGEDAARDVSPSRDRSTMV